jgi:hypothetical protein
MDYPAFAALFFGGLFIGVAFMWFRGQSSSGK